MKRIPSCLDALLQGDISSCFRLFRELMEFGYFSSEIFQLLLSTILSKTKEDIHHEPIQQILTQLMKHMTYQGDDSLYTLTPLYRFALDVYHTCQHIVPST